MAAKIPAAEKVRQMLQSLHMADRPVCPVLREIKKETAEYMNIEPQK